MKRPGRWRLLQVYDENRPGHGFSSKMEKFIARGVWKETIFLIGGDCE